MSTVEAWPSASIVELVASLSLAIDFGMGQDMESGLRTCLLATSFAERIAVDDEDRRILGYLSLIGLVGCTADAHAVASSFGDEIVFNREAALVDYTGRRCSLGGPESSTQDDSLPMR